jgi:hypothetical protein
MMSEWNHVTEPEKAEGVNAKQGPGPLGYTGFFLVFVSFIVAAGGAFLIFAGEAILEKWGPPPPALSRETIGTCAVAGSILLAGWAICLSGGVRRIYGHFLFPQIALTLIVLVVLVVWVTSRWLTHST